MFLWYSGLKPQMILSELPVNVSECENNDVSDSLSIWVKPMSHICGEYIQVTQLLLWLILIHNIHSKVMREI